MIAARTVAPNLGGRANTRSRAEVAISTTATRRHPGVSPRRHRCVVVVHLFNADRATVSPIGDQARFSRGRRPISRSLAGDCFTYAGLERDSNHSPGCNGAFAVFNFMRQLAPVMEAAGLTEAQPARRSR